MLLIPDYGAALAPLPNALTSRCDAHWRASDLSVDMPLCGLPGLFTRGGTASFVDSTGVSMTAVNAEPRWEPRDLDGDTERESMGLLMGMSDRLFFGDPTTGLRLRTGALAFFLDFVETGARTSANSTLLYIGNDGVTGARLWLDTSGTYYRVSFHNGTTSVTATLSSGQPTSGQRVKLWGQLYDDQSVQLWQSINDATATFTARTSGIAAPSGNVFAGTTYVRLNSRGSSSNAGTAWYRTLKLLRGLPDYTTLLTVR